MRSPSVPQRKLFWILQIGGWLTLALAVLVVCLFAMPPAVAVINSITRQVIGFVLTLGLAAIYRRWAWERFSPWRHGLAALGLSFTATAADVVITHLAYQAFNLEIQPLWQQGLFTAASLARALIYTSWSALYLALSFFLELHERNLRLSQAEVAARDAELQALRAQLNPHFLFNALNSIMAEADDNPGGVKAITHNLSELLRFSLRQRDHFGRLGAEIDAIESYLLVERSRFEERLDWNIEASPAARRARVPALLLLPLVENAIKYGFQTSAVPLQLRVCATMNGHILHASVENTGRWVEPGSRRSTGIGLNNLRRRLALLCGPDAEVSISLPGGTVRVDLQLSVQEERT